MKVEYDPKCVELARWFLDDEYGAIYDERLVNVLASVIQLAIDKWFEGQETKPGRREGMTAEEMAYAELMKTASAAFFALRIYQHGNSSTELAEEVADALEIALDKAKPVGGKA